MVRRRGWAAAAVLAAWGSGAWAQGVPTFGGDPQHTSVYAPPARSLARIRWSVDIDRNNSGAFAHYGAPLATPANTVIVPVKTETNGFEVRAFDGATGSLKYVLGTDYLLPSHRWIPVYNPALGRGPGSGRLWYAGGGGTLFHVDDPDSVSPGAPVRHVFYGTPDTYAANAAAFDAAVFVDTPLTTDSQGNVFFGFRVQGTAPAPLGTTRSGYARIAPDGAARYVLVDAMTGDSRVARTSHNAAPALSRDERTLYVLAKSGSTDYHGYLVALDAQTLETRGKVFLTDPRNGNGAGLLEDSTASPMVAPDGDVYLGIFGNPFNGSRGFLRRFSADLRVSKTPGGFGWDYTPAIVPASMVPSYTGPSSYLIFAKYNNYARTGDGDGVNRIALLDPETTQIDPHPSANGLVQMREVLTVAGPTPDHENLSSTYPLAVREWCINAPAVNPATGSVTIPCEDGRFYRWHLATNSLAECLVLNPGLGQPYVPTVVGPDGTIFTLNGGTLFALGDQDGVSVSLTSSAPDLRPGVVGQNVVFTARVGGPGPVPTGTVTFTDVTYDGPNRVETVLGVVSLDPSGRASLATDSLAAGGAFLGGHFVTATYGGDARHPAGSATLVQKVHAFASTTRIALSRSPVPLGQPVTVTVTVAGDAVVKPTGMVTLVDGARVLGQAALGADGRVAFSVTFDRAGNHTLTATYASDTRTASSSASVDLGIQDRLTETTLTAAPSPSLFAQNVVFTATVRAQAGGVPTGRVTLLDGDAVLAADLPLDPLGRVLLRTSTLAVGEHTVTARFTGTGGWQDSAAQTRHVVQPDVTAPTTPQGLTAISAPVPRAILLRWGASRDDVRVSGTEIWRALEENGVYTRVATVTGTTFIDNLPSRGAVRWYYVVARDPSGNRSAPSAKVRGVSL